MARSFNGTSDLISSALSNTTLGTPFTIAGWFKWDSLAAVNVPLSIGASILVSVSATDLRWQQDNGASPNCKVATARSVGTWYHVAVESTGSGAGNTKIFLSSVQADNGADAGTLQTGTLTLGKETTLGGPRWFPGSAAEIGLWSAILTVDEIKALVSGKRPKDVRPASLKGYFPLFGLQSPDPDLSGNANSGTLTGTTQANHAPVTLFTRKSRTPPDIPATTVSGLLLKRRRMAV